MPVPGSINDLSATPSQNSPQGSEPVGTQANEYIQAAFAFIKQVADGKVNNGTLDAPKGTRLVLQQASAPAGWVVDADQSLTDCSMRFNQQVSKQAGTTTWSGWNWGGQFAVDGHVLSINEIPSHSHGVSDGGHSHGVNDPGHSHGVNDPGHSHAIFPDGRFVDLNNASGPGNNGKGGYSGGQNLVGGTTGGSSGTGISIFGSGTGIWLSASNSSIGIQATGSNWAHSHTFKAPQVKYADCIVVVKQ
ncbi:hypothetical protein [Burkholderia cenocepacia]|uniref:hypothetical protein n=1 Tax=Burkholderia cenocepacia TaxID=95486 RepID=UPI00222E9D77|nr:hypothetical protein [Burkholderia cenocepacia]MCW3539344.1 hypothetical protein [Burkholderia cenocepacia]